MTYKGCAKPETWSPAFCKVMPDCANKLTKYDWAAADPLTEFPFVYCAEHPAPQSEGCNSAQCEGEFGWLQFFFI